MLQLTPIPGAVRLSPHQIPPTGRRITPRPRLVARLESATRTSRVVVVAAEAGAGKSTLVAYWAAHADPGTVVAWRGLGGDPRALPELLDRLPDDEPGLLPTDPRLDPVVRRVIVIDGFPVNPDRATEVALERLLNRTGPQVSLVLTCVGPARLDAERLGMSAECLAIDSAELAMNRTEIAAVLARHAIDPEPALVDGVWHRTRGWAWGVRLAAAAAHRQDSLAEQLRAVDRAVSDYLENSVLRDLSAEERLLLAGTSMVEQVDAGLVYALGDGLASGAVQRSRGFVRAHGDGSFTLQPLLRRHLHQRLHHDEAVARTATRRVADYLAAHGDLDAAVEIAVGAADWTWAARALTDDLRVLRFLCGPADPLLDRPEVLDGLGTASPTLLAAAALRRGWPDLAAQVLESDAGSPVEDSTVAAMLGAAVVRMALARWQGDSTTGLACHRRALTLLPQLSVSQRSAHPALLPILHAHRAAFVGTGEAGAAGEAVERARVALERAARSFRPKAGPRCDPAVQAAAGDCLGQLAWWQARAGELNDAVRHATDLLADPLHAAGRVGPGYARLAVVWCQLSRGDIQRAAELFATSSGSAPTDSAELPELVAARRLTAVRLAALGAPLVAGPPPAGQGWEQLVQLIRAESELEASSPAGALAILAQSGLSTADAQVLRARAAIQLGDVAGAAAAMRRRPVGAVTRQCQIQLELVEGWLAGERQDRAREHALVERALRASAREQLRASLGWAKPWLHDVVNAEPELLRRYGHFLATVPGALPEPPVAAASPGPVVPLTGRELDILQRLGALRTNEEIAADLFLSANTIKSHLKSLYRKLDVNRRSEAFHRGRALGLC